MNSILHNALGYSQENVSALQSSDSSLELAVVNNNIVDNYNALKRLSMESQMLMEVEQSLEAYQDLLSTTMESGGDISEMEDSFRITMESMFGKEYADTIEFSQEGIGRILKKIGQGSKNLAGRIQRRWKDFIASLGDGWGKLDKRIKEVESAAKSLPAKAAPSKNTVTIKGVSRLHINGKVDPTSLAKNYGDYMENIRRFAGETITFGSAFIKEIEETQESISQLDKKVDESKITKLKKQSIASTSKLFDKYSSQIKGLDNEKLPGGERIGVLTNPQFYISKSSRDQSLDELMIFNNNKTGEYKEKDVVPTPTPDEITTLMGEARQSIEAMSPLLNAMNQFIRDASELKKSGDNAPRIMKRLELVYGQNVSGQAFNLIGQLINNYFGNNVDKWINYIGENTIEAYNYTFQTTRALVEYCERGVKAYE